YLAASTPEEISALFGALAISRADRIFTRYVSYASLLFNVFGRSISVAFSRLSLAYATISWVGFPQDGSKMKYVDLCPFLITSPRAFAQVSFGVGFLYCVMVAPAEFFTVNFTLGNLPMR